MAGNRVWFKSSYCSFCCHSYRSLAGRNLYRNASKNILKTWPQLMKKLSGDSCSHQLQTWLLQFDGLRSRYSTETAICLGEQLRGLIGTNCFQHISLVLLITSKFNFTSHWRSHSPPFWQENNLEADFVTSATASTCQHEADLPVAMPHTSISWCFLFYKFLQIYTHWIVRVPTTHNYLPSGRVFSAEWEL